MWLIVGLRFNLFVHLTANVCALALVEVGVAHEGSSFDQGKGIGSLFKLFSLHNYRTLSLHILSGDFSELGNERPQLESMVSSGNFLRLLCFNECDELIDILLSLRISCFIHEAIECLPGEAADFMSVEKVVFRAEQVRGKLITTAFLALIEVILVNSAGVAPPLATVSREGAIVQANADAMFLTAESFLEVVVLLPQSMCLFFA